LHFLSEHQSSAFVKIGDE